MKTSLEPGTHPQLCPFLALPPSPEQPLRLFLFRCVWGTHGQEPQVGNCWGLPGSGEGTGAVPQLAQAGTCHSFQSTSGRLRRGFSPALYKILAISLPFPFLLGPVIPPFLPHTDTSPGHRKGGTGARQTGLCSQASWSETQRSWPPGLILSPDPWRTDRIYQRSRFCHRGGET